MGTRFCDLIERGRLLETLDWRERAIFLERHKLHELDLLALREGHDRFFPVGTAAQRTADAFLLSGIVAGVHIDHFLLEQTLHCVFDLSLVRAGTDPKNVLVMFFAQKGRLLGERRRFDYFVRFPHCNLSASFSSAFGVTKIFWNASSCSVFTSAAVASFTGLTFRADL